MTEQDDVVANARDVAADTLTVTAESVVFWNDGTQGASIPTSDIGAISYPEQAWSLAAARTMHVNAYRR
jgi:hypothetical protein